MVVGYRFNQIKDVDFYEVYTVVAKPISFKVFYIITATLNQFLYYVDIKAILLAKEILSQEQAEKVFSLGLQA